MSRRSSVVVRIPEEQWDEVVDLADKLSSSSVETSPASVLKTAIGRGLRSLNQKIKRGERRRARAAAG